MFLRCFGSCEGERERREQRELRRRVYKCDCRSHLVSAELLDVGQIPQGANYGLILLAPKPLPDTSPWDAYLHFPWTHPIILVKNDTELLTLLANSDVTSPTCLLARVEDGVAGAAPVSLELTEECLSAGRPAEVIREQKGTGLCTTLFF